MKKSTGHLSFADIAISHRKIKMDFFDRINAILDWVGGATVSFRFFTSRIKTTDTRHEGSVPIGSVEYTQMIFWLLRKQTRGALKGHLPAELFLPIHFQLLAKYLEHELQPTNSRGIVLNLRW